MKVCWIKIFKKISFMSHIGLVPHHFLFEQSHYKVKIQNCCRPIMSHIKICRRVPLNQWKKNWANWVIMWWVMSKKPSKNNLFIKMMFLEGFLDFSLYITIQLAQFFYHWFSSTLLQILICDMIGLW